MAPANFLPCHTTKRLSWLQQQHPAAMYALPISACACTLPRGSTVQAFGARAAQKLLQLLTGFDSTSGTMNAFIECKQNHNPLVSTGMGCSLEIAMARYQEVYLLSCHALTWHLLIHITLPRLGELYT